MNVKLHNKHFLLYGESLPKYFLILYLQAQVANSI